MPRQFLLSTPASLRTLQARHPAVSLQGPQGFISMEVVFRDARAADELLAAVRSLYLAAAQVYQETHVSQAGPTQAETPTVAPWRPRS